MIRQLELVLLPEEAADEAKVLKKASKELNLPAFRMKAIHILKRSIDARSKTVRIRLMVEIFVDEQPSTKKDPETLFHFNQRCQHKAKCVNCWFWSCRNVRCTTPYRIRTQTCDH